MDDEDLVPDYDSGLDNYGEEPEAEYALDYYDGAEYELGDALVQASDALGEFTFEELLDLNDMDQADALSWLYQTGEFGLPVRIEDEDEEVSDLPPEEAEDTDA